MNRDSGTRLRGGRGIDSGLSSTQEGGRRGHAVDGFEFVASIVKSVAWPSVVAFSLYLFRREIRPLLPYARMRLKHNDTEFELRLDDAKKTAEQLPQSAVLPPPTNEETQRFERVANRDPRAAILESWLDVETELDNLANTVGIDTKLGPPPLAKARWLREKGVIDPSMMRLFDDLRSMRNRAALYGRSFFPTADDAKQFRRLVDVLVAQMAEQDRVWRERNKGI